MIYFIPTPFIITDFILYSYKALYTQDELEQMIVNIMTIGKMKLIYIHSYRSDSLPFIPLFDKPNINYRDLIEYVGNKQRIITIIIQKNNIKEG